MKNIFYICTKSVDNLDVFTLPENTDDFQGQIALLILHKDKDLQNVHASHVWNLDEDKPGVEDSNPLKSISYQIFLEQIFLHDLTIVI